MSDHERTWDPGVHADLLALVKRADEGDQAVLPAIRQAFDAVPGVWNVYGDLAAAAETALIDLAARGSFLAREGLRMKVAEMRMDLAGPSASPLEQLMIERVVICWLQSYHADLAYARSLRDPSSRDAELHHRRQDRAARQYMKALRSLATLRRAFPPVQVNVAQQQVNLSGPGRDR